MATIEMPISKYTKAHGLWFRYLEWESEGPVVIFAHAAGFCADVWMPLANSIHQRGYRVLSIDLRGHGDSEASQADDYTFYSLGQDMAELFRKLEIKDAIAIGHSCGAVALMVGDGLAPGHIWCAFHMEPPILFRQWLPDELINGVDPLSRQAIKRRLIWESREQLADQYRGKPLFEKWQEPYFQAYIDGSSRQLSDGTVELKCSPQAEAGVYRNGLKDQTEVWEVLRGYRTPTTLLMTSPNAYVADDSAELELICRLVPEMRIMSLEGSSHTFPMEQPEEFERLLWEFVDEVGKEEARKAAALHMGVGVEDWQLPEIASFPPLQI